MGIVANNVENVTVYLFENSSDFFVSTALILEQSNMAFQTTSMLSFSFFMLLLLHFCNGSFEFSGKIRLSFFGRWSSMSVALAPAYAGVICRWGSANGSKSTASSLVDTAVNGALYTRCMATGSRKLWKFCGCWSCVVCGKLPSHCGHCLFLKDDHIYICRHFDTSICYDFAIQKGIFIHFCDVHHLVWV